MYWWKSSIGQEAYSSKEHQERIDAPRLDYRSYSSGRYFTRIILKQQGLVFNKYFRSIRKKGFSGEKYQDQIEGEQILSNFPFFWIFWNGWYYSLYILQSQIIPYIEYSFTFNHVLLFRSKYRERTQCKKWAKC